MRFVRLKETRPNVTNTHVPSDKLRSKSDDSLGEGPFIQRGTEDGFLHTNNERPAATRNLVMLGDSFVESMFVEESRRFPSQIERTLPNEWRVLNAGYSGMTTLHMLPLIASKLVPYVLPAGKLLIFIGQSDYDSLIRQGSYWSAKPTSAPIVPTWPQLDIHWEPEEALSRMIETLLSAADNLGLDYGVVPAAFRDGDFNTDPVMRRLFLRDRDRYREGMRLKRLIQETAREAAERRGRPFFDSQSVAHEPELFYDSLHLNTHGQDVFSKALGAWILDSFLPSNAQPNPTEEIHRA